MEGGQAGKNGHTAQNLVRAGNIFDPGLAQTLHQRTMVNTASARTMRTTFVIRKNAQVSTYIFNSNLDSVVYVLLKVFKNLTNYFRK